MATTTIDAPTSIAADIVTGSFTETNLLLRRGNRDGRTTNKAVVILVEGSRNEEKKKKDGEGKDASHHPVPGRTLRNNTTKDASTMLTTGIEVTLTETTLVPTIAAATAVAPLFPRRVSFHTDTIHNDLHHRSEQAVNATTSKQTQAQQEKGVVGASVPSEIETFLQHYTRQVCWYSTEEIERFRQQYTANYSKYQRCRKVQQLKNRIVQLASWRRWSWVPPLRPTRQAYY